MYDVPIVFIVYKRLDKTKMVLERIRELKPSKMYVIADGAKNENDLPMVTAVREYIDSHIDWNCEVLRKYSEKNYGLRNGIPNGLDWVFENEEYAVILEDDVVPEISFFNYCKQMLEQYANNEKVMMISGFNIYEEDRFFGEADITFGYFSYIWGWATWRRAWKKYERNIPSWGAMRKSGKLKKMLSKNGYLNYRITLDDLQYHWYNSWGFQWQYALFANDGVGIIPKHNMITNVGINDPQGEHFGDTAEKEEMIKNGNHYHYESDYQYKLPSTIERNVEYDNYFADMYYPKVPKLKSYKFIIRAKIHRDSMKLIRKMEKDEEYFNNILPEKYKLDEEGQRMNPGCKYKQIAAEELRYSAKAYLLWKLFKKNIYK